MDETRRSLSLGLGMSGILHPRLDRAVRDCHEAQHCLIQFTQGTMWTDELRATAWERATNLRAQTAYPMTMPNALVTVIQRMQEQYLNKKAPRHPNTRAAGLKEKAIQVREGGI